MHLRICRKRLSVKPSSPIDAARETILGELARAPADRVLHYTLQHGVMEVMTAAWPFTPWPKRPTVIPVAAVVWIPAHEPGRELDPAGAVLTVAPVLLLHLSRR